MKRKITKMGPASLVVSLPSRWVKSNRLTKEDEVEVEEQGNRLIISLDRIKTKNSKISIKIPTKDKFLRRLLCTPYVQGYDEIRIDYQDPRVFDLINNKALKILFGLEVIEQGTDYCILKNLSCKLEEDFDIVFKRILMSTSHMLKEILAALKKNDVQSLYNISQLELNNNRLTYLCLRTLNTQGYKEPARSNSLYLIISQIEQIVDNLRDICDYAYENKIKFSGSMIDIFQIIQRQFEAFRSLFNKPSIGAKIELEKQLKKAKSLVSRSKSQSEILNNLASIIDKLSHISREI